jgi:serine/threonine-protein kinase
MLTFRLRRLLRSGYGIDDVVQALRAGYLRRREEFLYEHGPHRSARERVFRTLGIVGLIAGGVALASPLIGLPIQAALPVGILGAYFGVLGTLVSKKWQRLREGTGAFWAKFWGGSFARTLTRVAAYRLQRRAVAADRPTEMAIASSAESLLAGLRKADRQALGDVPAVLRGLESQATALRARIEQLDASMAEVRRDTSGVAGAADRQAALVADLKHVRAAAEQRRSEVVAALENLRLDLLRIHAGAGSVDGITRAMDAARALSEDVDRLVDGKREVDAVLAKR